MTAYRQHFADFVIKELDLYTAFYRL